MNGEDPPGSNSVDKIAAILTLCSNFDALDQNSMFPTKGEHRG